MNKKLIISLINIIITLGVIIILVNPSWQSFWHQQLAIRDKEKEIETIQDIIDKTRQFEEIETEAKKVFLALPEELDKPGLIAHFDSLALRNGMILESVNFSEMIESGLEESIDSFPSITADLNVSGSYNDFKRFLKAMEKSARAMDAASIDFKSYSRSSASQYYSFHLTIKVYYQ